MANTLPWPVMVGWQSHVRATGWKFNLATFKTYIRKVKQPTLIYISFKSLQVDNYETM